MAEPPRAVGSWAPESPTISIGDTLNGRLPGILYQVEAQLGAGGVGAVYRVRQKSTGQRFALKILHRSHASSAAFRKRFEREAKALGALAHPNVVGITDYGTANDEPYLVMELLEGESLAERLRRRPLDAVELQRYGGELLRALAYVHREGLVHRDLKPGNVFLHKLVDDTYRAKVLDFGFVKFVEGRGGPHDSLTRTGELFGTPAYMAPEQIGSEETNARTDVYSLGVMLYEMVAGRRPYEGDPTDILRGHLVDDPPSFAEVCPGMHVAVGLESMIGRALSKRPEERFENAGDMLTSFEWLAEPLFGPRPAGELTQLGHAPTLPGSQPGARSGGGARGASSWSLTAWAKGVVHRAVRAGAIALIVLSLAVILASAFAIYGLPGSAVPAKLPEPKAAAKVVQDTVHATKHVLEQTGAALEKASEAFERELAPSTAPPKAEEAPQDVRTEAAALPVAVARPEARNPWRRATPTFLRNVLRAVEAGARGNERTLKGLRNYNREHPGDARGHLLLAGLYWNRDWKEDALGQYELAAVLDPSARGAPGMLAHLVRLLDRPQTAARSAALIAALYGDEALPALTQALEATSEGEHKARLEALRARLSGASSRP